MPDDETDKTARKFVSRAGHKLEKAINTFLINPAGLVCADFGCNTGGFTDCLLQMGASKVYAIDTGYGVLEWKLRKDDRVVVMERTNALHVELPEPLDLVTIDAAWTRQHHILPAAKRVLRPDGRIISLIKPHYEADKIQLQKGVLPQDLVKPVMQGVLEQIEDLGFVIEQSTASPIRGRKGNEEHLVLLRMRHDDQITAE